MGELLTGNQQPLFDGDQRARLTSWPDFDFHAQETMTLEEKFNDLLEEIQERKAAHPGETARYYAILNTELEKALAFYMIYLYPVERDL